MPGYNILINSAKQRLEKQMWHEKHTSIKELGVPLAIPTDDSLES